METIENNHRSNHGVIMNNELKQMSECLKRAKFTIKDLSIIWERFHELMNEAVKNQNDDDLYQCLSVCIGIHERSCRFYSLECLDFPCLELSESILYDSKNTMIDLTNIIVKKTLKDRPCPDTSTKQK